MALLNRMYLSAALKKCTLTSKVNIALEWRITENIFQANKPRKHPGIDILISDKISLKLKLIRREKEGYYTLTEDKIHKENVPILKIYAHSWLQLWSHIDTHTESGRLQCLMLTTR